jgi:hypothetical protein
LGLRGTGSFVSAVGRAEAIFQVGDRNGRFGTLLGDPDKRQHDSDEAEVT